MTTDSNREKREFLWNIHTSTNSYVQFADTKAAFCVGIASAFVAALFTGKAQLLFIKSGGPDSILGLMSLGAFGLLGFSIIAALLVVWPRSRDPTGNKFVFWDGIDKGFNDIEEFVAEFGAQTDPELTLHLMRDVYDLAKACARKYLWIDRATITVAGGVVLTILTLLMNKN